MAGRYNVEQDKNPNRSSKEFIKKNQLQLFSFLFFFFSEKPVCPFDFVMYDEIYIYISFD